MEVFCCSQVFNVMDFSNAWFFSAKSQNLQHRWCLVANYTASAEVGEAKSIINWMLVGVSHARRTRPLVNIVLDTPQIYQFCVLIKKWVKLYFHLGLVNHEFGVALNNEMILKYIALFCLSSRKWILMFALLKCPYNVRNKVFGKLILRSCEL